MKRTLRIRYRAESLLATLSGIALALTVVLPNWLEAGFGVTPDGGDGLTEWGLALCLLASTALFCLMARRDRRALVAIS